MHAFTHTHTQTENFHFDPPLSCLCEIHPIFWTTWPQQPRASWQVSDGDAGATLEKVICHSVGDSFDQDFVSSPWRTCAGRSGESSKWAQAIYHHAGERERRNGGAPRLRTPFRHRPFCCPYPIDMNWPLTSVPAFAVLPLHRACLSEACLLSFPMRPNRSRPLAA